MSFKPWIAKLNSSERTELLNNLLDSLSQDELAGVIDASATKLNEDGYDWEKGYPGTQIDVIDMNMLMLEETFEPTKLGHLPTPRSNEARDNAAWRRATQGVHDFASNTLFRHHGVDAFGAHEDAMEMGP